MPWARREAGQPAEALPAPFQTSRSSCGCCSCTTRTLRSGRAAAGHAAAAHPAGGGVVEALCCRAAQTSHATHGSSQLRQADELARPRRRRAGAGRRLPAITRRRRRSADAPRRRGGRLARRRQQHASARLMPRAALGAASLLGAPSLFWQRQRVSEDTMYWNARMPDSCAKTPDIPHLGCFLKSFCSAFLWNEEPCRWWERTRRPGRHG